MNEFTTKVLKLLFLIPTNLFMLGGIIKVVNKLFNNLSLFAAVMTISGTIMMLFALLLINAIVWEGL